MPVPPVARGELTLQAGWVPADQGPTCVIVQSSTAQAETASWLFPGTWTASASF